MPAPSISFSTLHYPSRIRITDFGDPDHDDIVALLRRNSALKSLTGVPEREHTREASCILLPISRVLLVSKCC